MDPTGIIKSPIYIANIKVVHFRYRHRAGSTLYNVQYVQNPGHSTSVIRGR